MKKSKENTKHRKKYKDESLEEEEEDDDYEDEFENDSFLVGDDEVDEENIYERPRLNLNNENEIGEAELESEVGSSDNEVIYEQQLNKKKSRLKKRKMTDEELQEQARMEYNNAQHENLRNYSAEKSQQKSEGFIEDDEEDENDFIEKNENDYISKNHKKIITGNKSIAHKIFTREINEEEEPYQERERESLKKNILMREDLAEDYMREEDIEIKNTDVPERFYLRFKGSDLKALNDSIDSEADWILEKMRYFFPNAYETMLVSIKKKIYVVLEYNKKNYEDIPYIVTYRRNIYEPELSPKDIWKIFQLDREWNKLFEIKYSLSRAFENIRYIALPDDRAEIIYLRYIENSKSITDLNDMETYIEFLKEMHYNEIQNSTEEVKNLRPNKSSQIQNFRRNRIDEFARKFAFGAYELSRNLEALATGDQESIISPPDPEVQPEVLAYNFITPVFDQELKVMTAVCKFLALELFSFPFMRNYARICFKTQCTISTEPTEEGKKELDAFHPSFRVKRLRNKPIETFNNDLFLDILEAEKKGWITLTINIGENFFKDLTDKLNHTYHSKQMNPDVETVAHGWRIMREEIIRIFVAEHCIPYFKKEIRQDLKEKAENFVINECGINFSKMLMTGPYKKKKKHFNFNKDDELLKEEEYPRVLSAIYDNAKNEVFTAMVDNNGEILEVCKFINLMTKPLKLLSAGERDLKKEDEEKLRLIIQDYKPDLIVIGANDLKCKYLKEHIGSLDVEGLRESDENKIWTTYGDLTIPRISASCPKVEKILGSLNYFYRQAVCLARFKQNPLAEICQLWHEDANKNFCLSLSLHPLQRCINPARLAEQLETEAVKVVNSVGVEINKSCEHQHLQSVVQFVSGLGPRKAHYLIEKINRNRGLQMRVMLITPPRIFEEKIFYNCAGFLKVKRSRDSQIYDFNPLDITRIHPENYPLANKIAKTAMDYQFFEKFDKSGRSDKNDKEDISEAIRIILRDPSKLNCLDLDGYIEISQEKGNKLTKFNINFIKAEFQNPFHDERPPHKDLTSWELFYLLVGDPTFKKGQMVNATVLRVDEEHVKCRLTNDLEATIWYRDIFEDNDSRPDEAKIKEMRETYKNGMILNARVKSINEVNFKIDLTLKPSELITVKNHMDVNRLQNNFFVLVEEEDYINRNFIKENKTQQNKYQPRSINNPNFKNLTYKNSLDYLRNKEIGAFVFRPSSKRLNYLTLTWKFFEDTYSHIEIVEEDKQPGMQIGKKLRIGNEEYGSLSEITDRYLKPCEMLIKDALNSRKFRRFESVEEFERKLKEEKNNNKSYTPYLFTILSEFPQYILMGYCPKVGQVVKEYIKVKPNGYFFHNEFFPNLEELSNWFKRNYATESYRDYLKRVRAPQVEENRKSLNSLNESSINFDFSGLQGAGSVHLASGLKMDLEERNSILAAGSGSSYDRERNNPSEHKSNRDRSNKSGKPCHICKELGHFANECPNRGSRSYNRDYNRGSDSRNNRFISKNRDFISHKRNRSPHNSEYSEHKSHRNEEKQNTWTNEITQENRSSINAGINSGNTWGNIDSNSSNNWDNKNTQANANNSINNPQTISDVGWSNDRNIDINANAWNSQNTETGWTAVNSDQNQNSNSNFNDSNSNNNFYNNNNNHNFLNNNREKNYNNNYQNKLCHNCGGEGHISKNCNNPKKNDYNRNHNRVRTCNRCNKEGHLSYNCPENANNYSDNPHGNDKFRKPKNCYNCHEDGHFAKDCNKPKNNRDNRYHKDNYSGNNNYRRDSNFNNNIGNYNRRDKNNFDNKSNNFDKQSQQEKPIESFWGNSDLFDKPTEEAKNDVNINNDTNANNKDNSWNFKPEENLNNSNNNQINIESSNENAWGSEKKNNSNDNAWGSENNNDNGAW